MHISHNAPYLFSFLLGITAVPSEIENNAYANFWWQIRCIMGDVQVAYGTVQPQPQINQAVNIHLWNTVRWGNIWHDTKGGGFHISPMDNLLPQGDVEIRFRFFVFVGKNPLFLTFKSFHTVLCTHLLHISFKQAQKDRGPSINFWAF